MVNNRQKLWDNKKKFLRKIRAKVYELYDCSFFEQEYGFKITEQEKHSINEDIYGMKINEIINYFMVVLYNKSK